jgi:hypothetical protein
VILRTADVIAGVGVLTCTAPISANCNGRVEHQNWPSAATVIWVAHMKTTIDIADPLLRRAKRLAAQRHTTLKAVVEEALRNALEQDARERRPKPLRTHTFRGRGLQRGLSWDDWNTLRALAYEERGG